jgi:hypothetical protein
MSPEGEAFALMLYAAWRDWYAVNGPGSAQTSSAMPAQAIFGGGSGCEAGPVLLAVIAMVVACTLGDFSL